MAYRIVYEVSAEEHLSRLSARDQVLVVDAVDRALEHEPTRETRNQKRMRPNPIAPWELRVRSLRVYFDVDEDTRTVTILAVGVKDRNRVRIGREELPL